MKMQKPQYIKHMVVEQAIYHLQDAENNEVILRVNYQGNTFALESAASVMNELFLEEAKRLAQGLLSRKHAVNLAEREQYL